MLETKRLFLRYFTEGDAKEAHELFCEEEAMRMVGMYPPFVRLEETKKRISEWITKKNRLAIVLTKSSKSPASIAKSNKQWVGTCLYQKGYKPLLINCGAVIWL